MIAKRVTFWDMCISTLVDCMSAFQPALLNTYRRGMMQGKYAWYCAAERRWVK